MLRYCLAFAASAAALASTAPAAFRQLIDVQLVAESATPKAGGTMLVGFRMIPHPGWHGYWSNPGESGLAPGVRWTVPAGVHFGPLQHPAPTMMRSMGMTSYVHTGPHTLLARMRVDSKLRAGTVLPITADLTWAACSDKLCVPQKARLSMRLTVGDGSPGPGAALLHRAAARLPKVVPNGSFELRGRQLILTAPSSARLDPAHARFFPDRNGYWNAASARVAARKPLRIESRGAANPPRRITGVLSDGKSSYRVTFERRHRTK